MAAISLQLVHPSANGFSGPISEGFYTNGYLASFGLNVLSIPAVLLQKSNRTFES